METQSSGQLPENQFPMVTQAAIGSSEFPEITEEAIALGAIADESRSLYTDATEIAPPTESPIAAETAVQKLQETFKDLDETTDWKKVVEAYVDDTEGMDLDRLKELFDICTTAVQAEGVEQLTAIADVNGLRETLAAAGYGRPVGERGKASEVAEPGSGDGIIGESTSIWSKQWIQATRYLSPEHFKSLKHILPYGTIFKLQDGFKALFSHEVDILQNSPPAIAVASALEDKAMKLFDEFKSKEQALLDEAEPVPLEIKGVSLLKQRTGFMRDREDPDCEERLRQIIEFGHPESFRRGLTSISFVEGMEPVPGIDKVGGKYYPDTASIQITVSPKMETIMTKLNHELIHHAQNYRMTTEMLSEWHDIIQAENVAVTPYVSKVQGKKDLRVPLGGSEDMADSGRLYLNDPASLLEKAPQRFEWFQKYYRRWGDNHVTEMKEDLAQQAAAKQATDEPKP